jgi:hypothetical protein
MKLYTRLIEAGVFVFWKTNDPDTSYNLKISIIVGGEKITLVDFTPTSEKNYYVLDHVGSGDYVVEMNAYRGERLYQTETKNIKIISSTQKTEENFQALMDELSSIESSINNIDSNIIDLYNLVLKIADGVTDPETIVDIRRRVNKLIERDW